MKPGTVAVLNEVNRRFYDDVGEEFSATRQAPWPGWNRVVERLLATSPHRHARHSILDVGSGNGRFAALLDERLGWQNYSYVGVDASPTLAAIARANGHSNRQLAVADVVEKALPFSRGTGSFDLVAAFGLFHHVPSWERRRSLLVELAARVAPGGWLAVSFWQFAGEERFARRFVNWDREGSFPSLDRADLEDGDHLLRWGNGNAVRYCHDAGRVEAAELTAASGLVRVETFRSDGGSGRLNLYHLLRHEDVTGV